MSFEDKVESILRVANGERSVAKAKLTVVEETIHSLVDRLKSQGIAASVEKTKQALDTWKVNIDGYDFELVGIALIDLSDSQNIDLQKLVELEFIEGLKQRTGQY
ncbi:hypothetical protein [Paenibacillus vini]|uniref:Uncharacterized protein n=1 Tax=Paenibacillus vini TaxID=1476024 RepID=A0ABQ4MFG0_9BACL|nr:hypothetical protein [Paenibacillus vini]GIP54738.1 hypothetical protein J42TS3_37730 [Paenibacillus vini]